MLTIHPYQDSLKLGFLISLMLMRDGPNRISAEEALASKEWEDVSVDEAMKYIHQSNRERGIKNTTIAMIYNGFTYGDSVELAREAPADLVFETSEADGLVRIKQLILLRKVNKLMHLRTEIMFGCTLKDEGESAMANFNLEFKYMDPHFWERIERTCDALIDSALLDNDSHRMILSLKTLVQQRS